MKPAAYPKAFFIVHRRFTGRPFPPEGTWGDIGDGPIAEAEDVIYAMLESWKDEHHEPDETDFRVWQIIPGKPAEDCTEWALWMVTQTLEDMHDE